MIQISKNEKIIIVSSGLIFASACFAFISTHIAAVFLAFIGGVFGGTIFCLVNNSETLKEKAKEKKSIKKQFIYFSIGVVLCNFGWFFPDATGIWDELIDLTVLVGAVSFLIACFGCKATE